MTDKRFEKFKTSSTLSSIDGYLIGSGQLATDGDEERSIAKLAYDDRQRETRVGVASILVAYIALGVGVITLTILPEWQGLLLIGLGGLSLGVAFLMSFTAGYAAAARAVADHRLAIKMQPAPALNIQSVPTAPSSRKLAIAAAIAAAGVTLAGAEALHNRALRKRGVDRS